MSPETNPHPTTAHITASISLLPAIRAWEVYLKDQANSPHTVKAFYADLLLLASYLPHDRTLGSITTNDLNNFLNWLQAGRGVPCSPKTLSRRITSVKAFFRWLHKFSVILIDPAEKVLQKTRPYALLRLLLDTAIKKSECLSITLNHIDLETPDQAILFIRYANPQHRYKERKIELSTEWVEAFHEYQAQYEIKDQLFPWSQRRLEYLLEDIGEEAKLDKHLSFDMCRWTSVLLDWKQGVDHNKIRQKLGISKIQWREISMKLDRLAS
jgi:integrase/recombinase XerD